MIFVGVDGGGTKTEAIVVDSSGRILVKGLGGPSNIAENGENVVRESLKEALLPVEKFVESERETILVMGMPAVGEIRGVEKAYGEIVEGILGIKPNLVVNDVVVGWAAGTKGRDGIHVVAGTGSIAYGRKGGKEKKCGGWGSVIGDEGSAYYIGRKVLQAVSMTMDGRLSGTILKDLVFAKYKFKDHYDFIEWIYDEEDKRKKISSVAPLAEVAAKKGDEVAMKILRRAAELLSDLVLTISDDLEFEEPLVTYSGSVLMKNEIVRDIFVENVKRSLKGSRVRPANLKPVMGAIILGFKIAGMPIPDFKF